MYNGDPNVSDAGVAILVLIAVVGFFEYLSNKNKNTPPAISAALTASKTGPLHSLWNCHTIKLPSGLKWNARRTITLFTNLLHILGSGIIFRITHENGQILFQIIEDRTDLAPHVISAIRSVYPEAIVETMHL